MSQLLLLVSWEYLISSHKKVNLQLEKGMCVFGSIYIDMIENRQLVQYKNNHGISVLS